MDDLIGEFLSETGESLALLDAELVRLEQNPGDARILATISRLVHTIRGASGFLGLKRLETIAEAAQSALQSGRADSFALIEALAQIKHIMEHLAAHGEEPQGDDRALLASLKQVPAPKPQPKPAAAAPRFAEPKLATPQLAPIATATAPVVAPRPQAPQLSPQAQREAIRHGLETPAPNASRKTLLEKLAWAVGELITLRQQLKAQDNAELAAPVQKLGALTRGLADALRGAAGPDAPGIEVAALIPVETGGARLALPEKYLLELLDMRGLGPWRIETIFSTRVLLAGNRVVPLVSLAGLLRVEAAREEKIAVIQVGEAEFALTFGALLEPEEAVQRPLPKLLAKLGLYRGCASVGGETPLLVLDPVAIARQIGFRQVTDIAPTLAPKPVVTQIAAKPSGFLLFRAGEGALKALRLEDVSRVEAMDAPRGSMRIATLPGMASPSAGEVVVLAGEGNALGLAVEQVVDVIEAPMRSSSGRLTINGVEAEVIDVERLRFREAA